MLWDDRGDEDPSISEHLTTQQLLSLQQLIEDFRDVFNNEPGRTTLAEHRIETGSAKPVRQRPYRLPHAHRETVQKELTKTKNAGIIVPSSSEWASPTVLVLKDGMMRMCVDYRRVFQRLMLTQCHALMTSWRALTTSLPWFQPEDTGKSL